MDTKRQIEIQEAVMEARRFIERAEKAHEEQGRTGIFGGPCNAAMKRASMDLTKALVKVRGPIL